MGIDKLGLSIFDMLGYLLPGYITLFAITIFEATFTKGKLFCLTTIWNNIFFFSILSYFLGVLTHSIFSIIMETYHNLYRKVDKKIEKFNLSKTKIPLYFQFILGFLNLFKQKRNSNVFLDSMTDICIAQAYNFPINQRISKLQRYILADSYLIAHDIVDERNSLVLREGFFKTSTLSFFFLFVTFLACLIKNGIVVSIDPTSNVVLDFQTSLFYTLVIGIFFLILNSRRVFFHRMKVDNIKTIFIAKYRSM